MTSTLTHGAEGDGGLTDSTKEPSCDRTESVEYDLENVRTQTGKLEHNKQPDNLEQKSTSENHTVSGDISKVATDEITEKDRDVQACDMNGELNGDMISDDINTNDSSVCNSDIEDQHILEDTDIVNSPHVEANASEPAKTEEENKVDILGNGLLIKQIVKRGDGRRPQHGEVVTVSVEGRLDDLTSVDNNDCLSFTLGDGDVITGLELCVPLMELNETCSLSTDSKYAYGSHGNSFSIPPHARVVYAVTLTTINPAPDYAGLSLCDIIKLAESKRQRGNYHFERADYPSAITSYTKALKVSDSHKSQPTDSTHDLQSLVDVNVKCYNNLAASQLKIEAYAAAVKSCNSVLKYSSENVKALFRKAKACTALGQLKDACVLLKKALELEPESRLIHIELSRLSLKMKNDTRNAKKMYQKMFGLDESKVKVKSNQWISWSLRVGAVLVTAVSVGVALYRYNN